ncbi:MAG: T9SS type A sorting domain-containing protein [Ignavibacteriales bacterium]|nr:T9SS type A sorting domain-containing protein [Ignavibacteriales bacterium]
MVGDGSQGKVVAGIGEAASGSFVYAVDEMDEVVAFAMTDKTAILFLMELLPVNTQLFPIEQIDMNAVVAKAVVNTNNFNPFVNVRLENDAPSDAKDVSVVTNYQLSQNFPNPFNPSTTIRYSIPEAGVVTVKVFNILGKEVATLVNGYHQAGSFNVSFDASNLSSGVYLYQIEAGSFKATKKLTLIK